MLWGGMKRSGNSNQLSSPYSMLPCWRKWSTITPPSTACLTTSVTCSPASCSMLWSSYTPCWILLIIPIIRPLQPHWDPFQFPHQRSALAATPTYCSCLHWISPAVGQAFWASTPSSNPLLLRLWCLSSRKRRSFTWMGSMHNIGETNA